MKRNEKVKNNVDDMIYQVLNYIDHCNLPDDEVKTLVIELLSMIIIWNCEWNPEEVDMASIITQVNDMLLILSISIPGSLLKNLEKYGYRETGK